MEFWDADARLDLPKEDETSSGGSEPEDEEATSPLPTPQQPTTSQQSFATLNDALVACAILLIKTYGYSARIERPTDTHATIYCNRHNSYYSPNKCCYHWAVKLDNQKRAWVVDWASSYLSHNHGTNPELAKDPTWRPRLHNLVVKKALELADAPSTHAIGKRKSRTANAGRSLPNAGPEFEDSDKDEIVASQAGAKRLKMNKVASKAGFRPPCPSADLG